MTDLLVPSLDHLKKAYAVTSRATQITPLLESTALARETGAARVFIKPESLQWAGSFKVRGAYWRLKQLSADEAKKGVVAYSSGNFAQGLAAAGQALGIPVTIVMPIDAPAAKRDAGSAIDRVAQLRQQLDASHAPLQLIHKAILERIAKALPANAFIASDMTQLAYTANYLYPSQAPRGWLHPTGYGTLGYGVPAGIGAKFGAPERPGLVLVGDGGFLYTAQELATATEELDSPLVVLLWNNDALGQIRDDMLGLDIEPVGVLPRNPDFALLGRAYGCEMRQPQSLDELERDLREGFAHPGVTLVELKHACAK